MSPTHSPTSRFSARGTILIALVALAAAFAFTIGVAATAIGAESASQATPQATVHGFLAAAEVNGDGVTAARYLTATAIRSFDASATAPTPQMFFTGDHLDLGGLVVDSDAALGQLSYRVVPAGADRRVEVSHGGQSFWFTLRPATGAEQAEFSAPPTPWRINSSVASLGSLPGPRHGSSGV
jgi:hypothetical protein